MSTIPFQIQRSIKYSIEHLFTEAGISNIVALEATSHENTVEKQFCSVINFLSPEIEGSLVLYSNEELLRSSHPYAAMEMPIGSEEIVDWAGELANQILGRIKNDMYKHGLKFEMTTPTVVIGRELVSPNIKNEFDTDSYHYLINDQQFICLIRLKLLTNIVFSDEETSQVESEGTSLLF